MLLFSGTMFTPFQMEFWAFKIQKGLLLGFAFLPRWRHMVKISAQEVRKIMLTTLTEYRNYWILLFTRFVDLNKHNRHLTILPLSPAGTLISYSGILKKHDTFPLKLPVHKYFPQPHSVPEKWSLGGPGWLVGHTLCFSRLKMEKKKKSYKKWSDEIFLAFSWKCWWKRSLFLGLGSPATWRPICAVCSMISPCQRSPFLFFVKQCGFNSVWLHL